MRTAGRVLNCRVTLRDTFALPWNFRLGTVRGLNPLPFGIGLLVLGLKERCCNEPGVDARIDRRTVSLRDSVLFDSIVADPSVGIGEHIINC